MIKLLKINKITKLAYFILMKTNLHTMRQYDHVVDGGGGQLW